MENSNPGYANDANNPNYEWISDENRDKQVQGATEDQVESLSAAEENYNNSPDNEWLFAESDLRDAPMPTKAASEGYGPDAGEKTYFANANGNDPDDDADDEEEEENDDWGHTDPSDSPLPDPMDPSGPGSAV